MLKGITQTATQLANVTAGKVGGAAAKGSAPFSSVIRREQPRVDTNTAGGPLSAQAAQTTAPAEKTAPGLAERHATRIVRSQRKLERAMSRAMRGADFSPQQLLALQMQAHKYSIEVETVSRVVDRLAGAVKQTMQTQI